MKPNNQSTQLERTPASWQTILFGSMEQKTNGIGIAGLILSLIGIIGGWVPYVGWIIWILGVIFSLIGVFKKPRGFALAGLILSVVGIIVIVLVYISLSSLFRFYK